MTQLNLLFTNDKPSTYPASHYQATTELLPEFGRLDTDITCDVCIVGGGYTGLSSALHLSRQGLSVVLLEAHRVGWGASGRNGGQVGSGYSASQSYLEKLMGNESARLLWQITEEATETVKHLINHYNIECEWKDGIIAAAWNRKSLDSLIDNAEHLASHYDYHTEQLSASDTAKKIGTDAYVGGVADLGAGQLNPLKFALGLAKAAQDASVTIHESTVVKHIQQRIRTTVVTNHATVTADFVVLACNGYLGDIQPKIARSVMPINNFIVATEPLDNAMPAVLPSDMAVYDSKFVVNYFRRTSDNRLLFGGGENYSYHFPTDIRSVVRKPLLDVFPQLSQVSFDYAWGGTLAITTNRMPHFEKIGTNILSASGYSGQGVAMATMAGKVISEAITGDANQFDLLASVPKQRFPGGGKFQRPLLALAMTWYALLDRLH